MMPTNRTLIAMGFACAFALSPFTASAQASGIQTQEQMVCPTWANSPLPEGTQGKPYSASLGDKTWPATAVQQFPPLPALPAGLTVAGGSISGTPTAAGQFSLKVQIDATLPCPGAVATPVGTKFTYRLSKTFVLKIRDLTAPTMSSFTATPSSVPTGGATIVVKVAAADNVVVKRVMLTVQHPDGHTGSTILPGPNGAPSGTWQQNIPLAANSLSQPAVYTFTVVVEDIDGNVVRGGPITATVAARSAEPARMIKKP